MNGATAGLEDDGLEVLSLADDAGFASRPMRARDPAAQVGALNRLARCFVISPDSLMQELVNTAVSLCGADSAGISIELEAGTEDHFYHWVATAGDYAGFQDARLPRLPSACGVCLERGEPQLFRVSQRFFEILGVEASNVTDGILLPWEVEDMRGTIFIMAHDRREAFDSNDSRIMQGLASFAAAGIRQQKQKQKLLEQASQVAAAAVANELAHQINNPLQSLTNLLFLAAKGSGEITPQELAQQALADLERLSDLVAGLLRVE